MRRSLDLSAFVHHYTGGEEGEKTTDVSQLATSQATKSDEEDIDYKSVRETEKICSCGLCDDIKSTPWPGS